VSNFQEHAEKSIPFYQQGHELILQLSDFFVKEPGLCYELGCSRGFLTKDLAQRHHGKEVQWIGVDCSPDMIDAAQQDHKKVKDLSFTCDDMATIELQNSDFMVAHYSIQFTPPRLRQQMVDKIYQNLNWGGAFVMFEKVRGGDARFQDIFTQLYMDYKLSQGYKAEEIMAKKQSLKGVLEPFSTEGNLGLLKRAGFEDISTVFKYLCFEGFLCIK
jgi:tRNA (cmo5U34)-methyltransferase